MHKLSNRFLLVAIAAAVIGMSGGLGMGVAQDFRLGPAHAHLNLLGWVSMFLYSLFYRAEPQASQGVLPHAQFWLATSGLTLMIPGLALVLLGYGTGPLVGAGALLTIISLLLFAAVALRTMRGPRTRTELARAGAGRVVSLVVV